MRFLALWCVLFPTLAFADEPPDAGVDAPVAPAAEAPHDSQAAPETGPPPDNAQPAEDDDKGKKKKKHKHDESAGDDVQGDLVHSDDVGGIGTTPVNFRFLLQTRYAQTFTKTPFDQTLVLDPRLNDGFSINRAFLRVTANPLAWLESKLLIDFAELQRKVPKHALKLAYAELHATDHVSVTVGLFKRTYSLLELLPIADYELANPGPTDDLIKNAELGGRDTGVMVHWSPLHKKKHLGLYLGAFSSDLHGVDARPYVVMTARIVSETKHWRFGVDAAVRPHGETPAPGLPANPDKGQAVSADITFHHKHYEVRSEWLWGSRSDKQFAGTAQNWMAAWMIAAMRIPFNGVVLMPAARFEWLDADLGGTALNPKTMMQEPIGRRFFITGAINVMNPTDNFRVLLDVSLSQVQPRTWPINYAPVQVDRTSEIVTLQAQVKI